MIAVINNPKMETNFMLEEFMCKCGCKQTIIDIKGIHLLQDMRDHFNKPIIICSAYRCPEHNKKVGGVENSQHLLGIAYDIKIEGVTPLEVAKYALEIGFKGIGVYVNNDNYFTHVDTRPFISLWKDNKDSKVLTSVKSL